MKQRQKLRRNLGESRRPLALGGKPIQRPACSLAEIASWFLQRLPSEHQGRLWRSIEAARRDGLPLRVGTLCSGTDSPVPALKKLSKALRGQINIEHTFSCEYDGRKRAWIQDNFGKLKCLFADVKDLCTGVALNYIAGETVLVPAVDIVIAGFVCKSVSTENNARAQFANCINDVVGKTGETFAGVMGYIRRYNPAVVICENVEGLVKRNGGREPVINDVRASFINAGYAFHHKILDTRHYLLPQRRRRCWMWGFRGVQYQGEAILAAMDVEALASSKARFGFKKLFRCAGATEFDASRELNPREERVVNAALSKSKKKKSGVKMCLSTFPRVKNGRLAAWMQRPVWCQTAFHTG